MKKLLLTSLLLFLSAYVQAFDVYSSSSPAAGNSGVLCPTGTISYLYSVCVSSPTANTGENTQVFGSTFSNTAANRQRTRQIQATTFGCVPYQVNFSTNGLFYQESGTTHQFTYTYLCQ